MATIKEEAKRLVDRLPDEASWDDLMYQIYVQKKIEMGLKAADSGKLVPHDEVIHGYRDISGMSPKPWEA
jgi:predicted transcriptional regulator